MRRTDTRARLELLAEAVDLAEGRQDESRVAAAEAVLRRSRERLARGADQVVVALGGGTGSGTSSLSNALAGHPFSRVGPVRPTTQRPLAWTVGPADSELLDWLGVLERQVVTPREDLPEGLVVLDLPDHDSVRADHRAMADAALEAVDVMVFVVDPLKYAQRALFEGYLRPLAHHADVVLVVLNRADELDDDGERACLADLHRLLEEVGLGKARVLVTSAATGRGVDELRAILAEETRSRRAVEERIDADVTVAAEGLGDDVDAGVTVGDTEPVVAALSSAADLSGAVATARATYAERAFGVTRPPLTGVLARTGRRATVPLRAPMASRLRPPPLDDGDGTGAVLTTGASTSTALRHALRTVLEPLIPGLPDRWGRRLRDMVDRLGADLAARTREALELVALRAPHRLWWPVTAFLWTLVELAVLVGAGWLLALFLIGWLQLPEPPTPRLGEVPWPTVLVLAGVPLWLLIRGLRSVAIRRGARRHAERIARRLRTQVAAAAEVGLRPLHDELTARDRLLDLVRRLDDG